VLSSHCFSSSLHCRMMSSLRANSFPIILWFMGQLGGLDQIFDESLFSLIGESIISIIVECNLPTNKTWWFCVVDEFPWLDRHGGLFPLENHLRGLRFLWNKKRNLKPPWPWKRLRTSCSFDK
ncbi:unnamed protein product, partial [Brassica rapa]